MKKRLNKVVLLLLSLLLYNCSSYNNVFFMSNGDIEEARINVINDFVNNNHYQTPQYYLDKREGKAFNVFWIIDENIEDEEVYAFAVFPENNGYLSLNIEDSLGEVPKTSFPNNYMQKGEMLFIWNDSTTPLSQDVLNILNNYHILDSVNVKIALGLLSKDYEDDRMVVMDNNLKSVHYYICQSNMKRYKKVVTDKALGYYKRPNLRCSVNVK